MYGRAMKHLTYAEKSLLVGDEMADVLLEYAARLAYDEDAGRGGCMGRSVATATR